MQAGADGLGNLMQAACNGVSGVAPPPGNPDGKQRRPRRAKSERSSPTSQVATGGNGNGAHGAPLQKNGIAFSSSDPMAGVGGLLNSFTNASKAVVGGGQAAIAAVPGADIGTGAVERLARASQGTMDCAQAAVAAPADRMSKTVLGRVLQTEASSA